MTLPDSKSTYKSVSNRPYVDINVDMCQIIKKREWTSLQTIQIVVYYQNDLFWCQGNFYSQAVNDLMNSIITHTVWFHLNVW